MAGKAVRLIDRKQTARKNWQPCINIKGRFLMTYFLQVDTKALRLLKLLPPPKIEPKGKTTSSKHELPGEHFIFNIQHYTTDCGHVIMKNAFSSSQRFLSLNSYNIIEKFKLNFST
jgi:hypothetical protein